MYSYITYPLLRSSTRTDYMLIERSHRTEQDFALSAYAHT